MEQFWDKLTTFLQGAGFICFLIFASAVDGPDESLKIVYTGLIVAAVLMGSGAFLGQVLEAKK